MEFVDLSVPLSSKSPAYPGDPASDISTESEIYDGVKITHTHVSSVMHIGTHMDAPLHMIENGKMLSDYPASRFFGRGVLVEAVGKKSIEPELLEKIDIQKGDIVLVRTDHINNSAKLDYFDNNPVISNEFAQAVAKNSPSILGLDTFSPDNHPYETHKILLGNDVLIIENLCNLERLAGKKFEVIALPVNFDKTEAAFCRVVARIFANNESQWMRI